MHATYSCYVKAAWEFTTITLRPSMQFLCICLSTRTRRTYVGRNVWDQYRYMCVINHAYVCMLSIVDNVAGSWKNTKASAELESSQRSTDS